MDAAERLGDAEDALTKSAYGKDVLHECARRISTSNLTLHPSPFYSITQLQAAAMSQIGIAV